MSRTFGKRVISIAAYFSLLLVFLLDVGFVSTSAEPAQEQVQRLFETYIASVGNNFVAADALTAVGGTAMKEYFIRHAVDGVIDEDPNYPLNIPGNDGYVAAVVTVSGVDYGVIASIGHTNENLGTLTVDVFSESNANFVVNTSDPSYYKILQYTGNAQKLVFPVNANGRGYAFHFGISSGAKPTNSANVKVVMIGDESDTAVPLYLEGNDFNGWNSLRAMSFPKNKVYGYIATNAVTNNPELKYIRLPKQVRQTNNTLYDIKPGAFMNNPQLENARAYNGLMPEAKYGTYNASNAGSGYTFKNTAIRDFYLPATTDMYVYGGGTAASNEPEDFQANFNNNMAHGVDSVIVTAAQRNAPTLAQMAVLAQQAVDALDDTSSVDQFRMAIESVVSGAEVTVTRVGEQVIATLIKNDNSISLVCNRASSEGSEEERIQLAGMVDHQSGASDVAADDLRHDIINSPNPSTYTGYNNVTYSGTTYYVSASGNDNNNGTSPDTPWKSISKINSANLSAGSKVLFRRGDTFRGYIVTKSNVYYGAYGEGVKPNIYGSYKNYADSTSTWTEDTAGIWKTKVYDATGSTSNKESLDVGVIVGNHGEFAGKKKLTAELNANGDFFYDKSSGYVYIKMPVNPANHFTSIEIGVHRWLVAIPANSTGVTVENLNLKYTGGYGVVVSGGYDGSVVSNTVIKNCEFGFIGGSYDYNANVSKGNGVEFWAGCNGGVVENCWFYQIYDSAITHQASISDNKVFTAQNLTFCGNVIEYCGMYGIEYWVSDGADSVGNVNRMLNIVYDANIIRFSGYGHGGRAGTGVGIGSPLSNSKNLMDNFVVSNNIVDTARYYLIHMVTTQWKANLNLPTMINNTLIQREGDSYSWGAYWTNQGSITYYPATEQGTLDAAARLNGTGSGNTLTLQ